MKITLRLLKRLNACEDALEFFEKNKLEGFDSDWIKDIPRRIKLNGYVGWLNDKFGDNYKIIEDNDNNELTFEYSSGFSWVRTYDENSNELTYKYFHGYSRTSTYDENSNELTFKDSRGYSWTKTYDENSNELTFKNSNGYSWTHTYDENGRLLSITENNVTFNIPWND